MSLNLPATRPDGNREGHCVFIWHRPFSGSIYPAVPSNGAGMKETSLPFQIRIATPCPARWEDMGGDDRVRFCDQCRKNVYNLSAMTAAEATALLQDKKGKLCARIYQRADGSILTEDCPVGIARQWRRVKTFAGAALGTVLFVVISATALARDSKNGSAKKELRQTIVVK